MVMHVRDAPRPTPDDATKLERYGKTCLARRDLNLNTTSATLSTDVTTLAGEPEEADEVFWNRHVCRGEKLTEASLRNKDTAINFVRPVDSQFDGTMEDEMKTWGYTDNKGISFYCHLDDLKNELNSIGIDTGFKEEDPNGQNECFHVFHSSSLGRRLYKVDGKTYQVSYHEVHISQSSR